MKNLSRKPTFYVVVFLDFFLIYLISEPFLLIMSISYKPKSEILDVKNKFLDVKNEILDAKNEILDVKNELFKKLDFNCCCI